MLLRDQLSKNWPKYLPTVVQSLNERHIKSLGGIQPISIHSNEQDLLIRSAQEEQGITVFHEPSYQEQNQNQANYEANKSNPFQVGEYVYVDFKSTAFDKSFDTQVRIIFFNYSN